MRKFILSAGAFLVFVLNSFAQSPESFNYQAVVRDAAGKIIANQTIGMQISIIRESVTGAIVYQETFAPASNAYGLVNLEIGMGNVVQGTFAAIDWAVGPYFIETAMDAAGGVSYKVMGISQLMSVPYALHAKTAENIFSGDYTDLKNQPVIPSKTSELANDSGFITNADDADTDASNEIQVLSIRNDTIFLSNGGFVKLPADNVVDDDSDPINELIESIQLNGTILEIIENGQKHSVDLSGLSQAAYDQGVQDGQFEGYGMGYNDGYADGDGDGRIAGYDLGYDDGIADGYDIGYADGYADGSGL